ncbi:hypothetical protein FN846DRAFT_686322 [Sphaerosporella brunnea]|uniref:Uncharacterized protein n=1 Tax=Sphaerosporella brunnea TaxID=1250544 RepID=A0A5J5EZM4_9PEZI|nr:hypothetical protein FN846DRAFT_686322 [Sphaerosporella brunnea]
MAIFRNYPVRRTSVRSPHHVMSQMKGIIGGLFLLGIHPMLNPTEMPPVRSLPTRVRDTLRPWSLNYLWSGYSQASSEPPPTPPARQTADHAVRRHRERERPGRRRYCSDPEMVEYRSSNPEGPREPLPSATQRARETKLPAEPNVDEEAKYLFRSTEDAKRLKQAEQALALTETHLEAQPQEHQDAGLAEEKATRRALDSVEGQEAGKDRASGNQPPQQGLRPKGTATRPEAHDVTIQMDCRPEERERQTDKPLPTRKHRDWVMRPLSRLQEQRDTSEHEDRRQARQTEDLRQANIINRLNNENVMLKRALDDKDQQHALQIEQLLSEKARLKEKIDELHNSHVLSLNSVGTGLEPISDQTFEERFRVLHDDVNFWCRKLFKKAEVLRLEEMNRGLQRLLEHRLLGTEGLTFSYLLDMVSWAFMEETILSRWFPTLPADLEPLFETVEGHVRQGDLSTTKERSSYWGAYTKSLLFQDPGAKDKLKNISRLASGLLNRLIDVQKTSKAIYYEDIYAKMEASLIDARFLAADLKCQRGYYEIDSAIRAGDPYDEQRMADVTCTVEAGESGTVSAILSKGWVKRPFRGAKVEAVICKARVLVVPNARHR